MKIIDKNKIQQTFEAYDEASNRVTEYIARSLNAKREGNNRLSNYIEKRILPYLTKKSYKLFCLFNDEVQRLTNSHESSGTREKK